MRQVIDQGDLVYLDHQGVKKETDMAKLYDLGDQQVWIPKSQIKDENDEIVAIPRWLAEAKGLEGDW